MAKQKVVAYSKWKITPCDCRLSKKWVVGDGKVNLFHRFEQEIGGVEFVDVVSKDHDDWLNTVNEVVFRLKERSFEDLMLFVFGSHEVHPAVFQYKWDEDDVIVRMGW